MKLTMTLPRYFRYLSVLLPMLCHITSASHKLYFEDNNSNMADLLIRVMLRKCVLTVSPKFVSKHNVMPEQFVTGIHARTRSNLEMKWRKLKQSRECFDGFPKYCKSILDKFFNKKKELRKFLGLATSRRKSLPKAVPASSTEPAKPSALPGKRSLKESRTSGKSRKPRAATSKPSVPKRPTSVPSPPSKKTQAAKSSDKSRSATVAESRKLKRSPLSRSTFDKRDVILNGIMRTAHVREKKRTAVKWWLHKAILAEKGVTLSSDETFHEFQMRFKKWVRRKTKPNKRGDKWVNPCKCNGKNGCDHCHKRARKGLLRFIEKACKVKLSAKDLLDKNRKLTYRDFTRRRSRNVRALVD